MQEEIYAPLELLYRTALTTVLRASKLRKITPLPLVHTDTLHPYRVEGSAEPALTTHSKPSLCRNIGNTLRYVYRQRMIEGGCKETCRVTRDAKRVTLIGGQKYKAGYQAH